MLALIDGDIVCYRTAAVNENAAEGIAKWQADQLLTRIIEDVNATDWAIYLSGDNNFRYQLYPDYKANRRDMVRPKHLESVREHLVLEWNAVICDGYEADDALGIGCMAGRDRVVCSIDKDLLQLPGLHYNFVRREIKEVNAFDGAKWFYTQLLTGDATDNIRGCPGIGPVKAEKAFRGCNTERELFDACIQLYWEALGNDFWEDLELNADLLYVWRKENDKWNPPTRPDQEVTQ